MRCRKMRTTQNWQEGKSRLIGLSSPCCAAITNHSALFTASNGSKVTDQSRTKDLKLESMSMLGESSKTTFSYTLYFALHHLKAPCLVLSVSNKRAFRASDCKMSWYFSIDSLTHAAENKLLVVRKQTSRQSTPEWKLIIIWKWLSLSAACQQLSNYSVNRRELFMRQIVNWWLRSYQLTSQQRQTSFHKIWHSHMEKKMKLLPWCECVNTQCGVWSSLCLV